jgi:putative ABC transport system ATP-binding protein
MIELQGLIKRYGSVRALNQIDLKIVEGEWISIMGPSGSGKTTLLNLIGCLDRPTEGNLKINGTQLSSLSSEGLLRFRKDHIGMVFQEFYLVPYLTALENVMLAQYYHSMVDEREAIKSLHVVGLEDRIHHLPSGLSTGEQQRVAIARAMINQPKILLADEPTGNLDEENEGIVIELLEKFQREGGTLILATHDIEIGDKGDRQLFLDHGRMVVSISTHDRVELGREELLRELWIEKEKARRSGEFYRKKDEDLIKELVNNGFLNSQENEIQINNLTEEGEKKGKELTRRHRIAERFFSDVFKINESRVDNLAHQFDYRLSSQMTENLCIFMDHPRTCPHGDPIPPGKCCREKLMVK